MDGGYTAADICMKQGYRNLAEWLRNQRKLTMREAEDVGPSGTYYNGTGLVIFLNYIRFVDANQYRKGACKDKRNIITTFNNLGYSIDYHENLSKPKTISILENLKQDKRLCFKDSLILIINSHGEDRKTFFTSDGGTHDINEIKILFTNTNCPQMKNKPKLLITNFCRGKSQERVTNIENVDNVSQEMEISTINDAESTRSTPLMIELSTHLGVICSVSEGVLSCRSEKTGSFFLQYICETLGNNPEEELNVIINTVADKMKATRLPHPTDLYERPFRKFVFKLRDAN
ncbi:unnamed protein product [Meganyctiphanes norvegica]|uniref:Caspase family p20 domain-containing protein n=1 Tax=Meganyctiphanes norvegica TaxID=48144 RepID=A0AAV2PYK0_MEGNR